jgi:ankyrin repeat protein
MKYEASNDHPIFHACLTGDANSVSKYLKDGVHPYANGVLSAAIRGGHSAVFQAFLDNGLDINQPFSPTVGVTPIFRTIEKKQMAILKLLLKKGACVGYDPSGSSTPLHAASGNWPDAIPVLLEAGADANAKSTTGRTPLMQAAYGNQIPAMDHLIEAGANLEDRDKEGTTALILAARAGKAEVLEWLLDHGSNIGAKDDRGKTAEDWARENDHPAIVELIKSRMGV